MYISGRQIQLDQINMSIFNPDALKLAVKKALDDSPQIPIDAKGAFLIIGTQEGARAVVAARIKNDWLIQGCVEYDWKTHDTDFYVQIKGTF